MSFDRIEERNHFAVRKRLDLGLLNLWKVWLVGWIVPDISERNGLFQCFMQRPVYIFLGLCGKRLLRALVRQIVIKPLNIDRI